jgi:hypothetical protein
MKQQDGISKEDMFSGFRRDVGGGAPAAMAEQILEPSPTEPGAIPGVGPGEPDQTPDGIIGTALQKLEFLRPLQAPAGWISAEVQAQKEMIGEHGLIKGAIKGVYDPAEEKVTRRNRILGVPEDAEWKEVFNASIDFQENRESLFWGEKFVTEFIFDPLWFVPVGKGLSVARSVLKGGRKTPVSGLAKQLDTTKNFDLPSDEMMMAEGYTPNKVRRMTQSFFRSPVGKLPIIRQTLQILNPSGIRDAVAANRVKTLMDEGDYQEIMRTASIDDVKEYASIAVLDMHRLSEIGDNAIASSIAGLRADYDRVLKNVLIHRENDVFINVRELASGNMVEKSFGDVISNQRDYVLPEDLLAHFKKGDELITEMLDLMKKTGVSVKELPIGIAGGPDHYWPRFVKAFREVENVRSPIGGRMVGTKAGFMFGRLHELQEEALKNGVKYFGTGAKDAYSDVLETYLRGAMKMVVDERFAKRVRPLGSLIDERIGKEITQEILASTKRHKAAFNANIALKNAFNGLRLPGASIENIRRVSPKLGEQLDEALKIADEPTRSKRILEIQQVMEEMVKADEGKLREFVRQKKVLRTKQRAPAGTSAVAQPALTGRMFQKEVADILNKGLGSENVGDMLRFASDVSSAVRTTSLTLDFGFPLLQGAMVLTNAPRTWVRANVQALKTLLHPRMRQAYLARSDTKEVLRSMGHMLHVGGNEMLEGIRGGGSGTRAGLIPKLLTSSRLGPLKGIFGKPILFVLDRFAGSFEMFLDYSRIEMAKGMMPALRNGQASATQIANHINKMTGVISSRALGVSASQRELEAAMFFLAPRWTRAVTGMAGMALQGGWDGNQAFLALSKFFAGTTMLYAGLAGALGKPIKLDPRDKADGGDGSEFMTIDIGNDHIGFGGKMISLSRLLMRMRANPTESLAFLEHWYRGQPAPVGSIGWDLVTGETYLGDPLKNPDGSMDWGTAAFEEGTRMLPFWIQAMTDDPRPGFGGSLGEFFGARSWPVQASEKRDDFRDELAGLIPLDTLMPDQLKRMEEDGLDVPTWRHLTPGQQSRIKTGKTGIEGIDERMERLKFYEDKATEISKRRGEQHITEFFDSIEDNITNLEDDAMLSEKAVLEGEKSPEWFFEKMKGHLSEYGTLNKRIYATDGPNALAIEDLRNMNERAIRGGKFVSVAQQAKEEYIRIIVGADDLVDSFDDYDFDEAEKRKNSLINKYGTDVMNDVEESFLNNKDMPSLYRNWIEDRERLQSYWEVKEEYISRTPGTRQAVSMLDRANARVDPVAKSRLKRHPAIRRMNSFVDKQRKALRMRDPYLDALLFFWGRTDTILTPQAMSILQRLRSQRLRGQGQAT